MALFTVSCQAEVSAPSTRWSSPANAAARSTRSGTAAGVGSAANLIARACHSIEKIVYIFSSSSWVAVQR